MFNKTEALLKILHGKQKQIVAYMNEHSEEIPTEFLNLICSYIELLKDIDDANTHNFQQEINEIILKGLLNTNDLNNIKAKPIFSINFARLNTLTEINYLKREITPAFNAVYQIGERYDSMGSNYNKSDRLYSFVVYQGIIHNINKDIWLEFTSIEIYFKGLNLDINIENLQIDFNEIGKIYQYQIVCCEKPNASINEKKVCINLSLLSASK